MQKLVLVLLFSPLFISLSYGQCTVDPFITDSIVDCEDSTAINIVGYALSAISESFSASGPNDPGWQTTAGAIYTNPYIPSPTNDTYFWMGATAVLPATLETVPFNVSYGGQICFDFVYAVQGGAAPTEGPDLSEEGITLQYSPDGGTTWVDIVYFMPNGEQLASNPGPNYPMNNPPFSATGTPYTVWNSVCFPIPAGAIGTNTSFQWIQEFNSGACCDHWGLDNISIQLADPAYTFYDSGTGASIDSNLYFVSPTSSTTYNIIYTNGVDDTCFGSVFVFVEPTEVMDDFYICEGVGTGDTLSMSGVAPWASVLWTPSTGLDNPSSQTPFANPPSPGPSQTYTATSACGSDSVTVTFYSVDATAENDTVCPSEINQLYGNVEGISQACETDYTPFQIPFKKEFSSNATSVVYVSNTNQSNGISPAIPIAFPFKFYCVNTSQVRMNEDGYLAMSSAGFPSQSTNGPFPNATPNSPIIALMWGDLADSSGLSKYFVTGNAPNRKMVFEFDLVHIGGNSSNAAVTGQIILHETTNFIDILCENCMNDIISAATPTSTQGMKASATIGEGTPGRNNTLWFASNDAYRFIPNSTSSASQTISWTPATNIYGANTLAPIVIPNTTTQYVVTVVNNWSGCTYSDSIIVYVDSVLTVDAGADTSICFGDTLTIQASASGATAYSWSPNNGSIINNTILNAQVFPDITTTYTILASKGACQALDTITVGISNFVVDSTAFVDEICVANSGSITIYTSGQAAGLQYSIDNGTTLQASNVFNGLTGGTYIVLIGSANCDTTYTLSLIAAAAPILPDSIVITDANCGNLGAIDLFVSGGQPPLQYSIDNGTTFSANTNYPNLPGGNFSVQVLDGQGCLFDSLVILNATTAINLLVDSITPVSCNGAVDGSVALIVTGGLAPVQYSLDDIAYGTSSYFSPLDTGFYTAYALDANGCKDSLNFQIFEPAVLDVQITVPGNVLCAGGTIDSLVSLVNGGTAAYTYLWSTAETTPNIQNIVFGTYWIVTTDVNNCQATDTVIISQPIPLYLTILNDSVVCGGQNSGTAYIDSVSGGIQPYTYAWTGPNGPVAGNDTAINIPAGQYILTIADFNGCTIADTTTILEPSPVLIVIVPTNLLCNGDANGCVDATVTGGTLPYSYSWSNGITTEDQCGLSAGWYVFNVTDSRGCIYTDSVEITQPAALALTIAPTAVTCYGFNNGSATATVSGGTPSYTYTWTGSPSTTASAPNLFAGTVVIDVVDLNGCIITDSVIINQPTDSILLTVDNITNILCNGASTGAIHISTSGGTTPYTYAWTNGGGTNEDLSNAATGTYTLTVTDANGCPMSVSATINQYPALGIVLVPTNVTCFGASTGAVQATVSGGNDPYVYSWTGPNAFTASTQNITGLVAGTYTLSIVDSNNCTLSQNTVVNEPAVVSIGFTSSPVNCFGGNDGSLTASVTSGGTAPFTFQWDASANNQGSATATGLSAGNFTVTITDANGCAYNNNTNVTQPAAPLAITLDSTNVSCAGYDNGIALVAAQGGTPTYTYLWNDPQVQTTAEANNLAPGNYQVIVTDNRGCIAIGSINIEEPAAISISVLADSTNCFGEATGALQITAGGGTNIGYAYSIDGGLTFQNSPDFFNIPAGIYDGIIVQDLGSNIACLSQPISATVYEQPYFYFEVIPNDTTLQLEESLTLDLQVNSPNYTNASIVQVIWYPSTGLNCSDCIDPTILTYDHYTEYTATIYYLGGDNELCNQLSSTVINVENNLQLFIPNAFTPGSFDDMNNVFEVYGEGIEYITMQVCNRWGEKVFESSNQKVAWDGTYKGEMQSPGVFTFYVSVDYLDGKTVDKKGSVTLIR